MALPTGAAKNKQHHFLLGLTDIVLEARNRARTLAAAQDHEEVEEPVSGLRRRRSIAASGWETPSHDEGQSDMQDESASVEESSDVIALWSAATDALAISRAALQSQSLQLAVLAWRSAVNDAKASMKLEAFRQVLRSAATMAELGSVLSGWRQHVQITRQTERHLAKRQALAHTFLLSTVLHAWASTPSISARPAPIQRAPSSARPLISPFVFRGLLLRNCWSAWCQGHLAGPKVAECMDRKSKRRSVQRVLHAWRLFCCADTARKARAYTKTASTAFTGWRLACLASRLGRSMRSATADARQLHAGEQVLSVVWRHWSTSAKVSRAPANPGDEKAEADAALLLASVFSGWKLACCASRFLQKLNEATADARQLHAGEQVLSVVWRHWSTSAKVSRAPANPADKKALETPVISAVALLAAWRLCSISATKHRELVAASLAVQLNKNRLTQAMAAWQTWRTTCKFKGLRNQAVGRLGFRGPVRGTSTVRVFEKVAAALDQSQTREQVLRLVWGNWLQLCRQNRQRMQAMRGCQSIAALVDRVDHGFLRLVWCMWAGYLDLAARLARSGSKVTSLLNSFRRSQTLLHTLLNWRAVASVAKVKAAAQSLQFGRLGAGERWIHALERADVCQLLLAWRSVHAQHLLYERLQKLFGIKQRQAADRSRRRAERSFRAASTTVLRSRRDTRYFQMFWAWREAAREGRVEEQLESLKAQMVQAAISCRTSIFEAALLAMARSNVASEGLLLRLSWCSWHRGLAGMRLHRSEILFRCLSTTLGMYSCRASVCAILTAWRLHCCNLAQPVRASRGEAKAYFLLWKASVHGALSRESEDNRLPLWYFLAAWKLGTRSQAVQRQLQDGISLAAACTSAALQQGYIVLLQRVWDAWIVQAVPPLLVPAPACAPLTILRRAWFREDVKQLQAALLAWQMVVMAESLPAESVPPIACAPLPILRRAWFREDVKQLQAALLAWRMVVMAESLPAESVPQIARAPLPILRRAWFREDLQRLHAVLLAWRTVVMALPAESVPAVACAPLTILSTAWFREDLQRLHAALLAWRMVVMAEALPAESVPATACAPLAILRRAWFREDLQLVRSALCGWRNAVLACAYSSDLRLLEQRLASAASHVHRLASCQQAEQREAYLRQVMLSWRVAALQRVQEHLLQVVDSWSEHSASEQSSPRRMRAILRQVFTAWRRSAAKVSPVINLSLEDERCFMLRELTRLQSESKHRTVDMLEVMALSQQATLTEAQRSEKGVSSSGSV
ncbi:unnamed protein product [Effrenium voratum]|uniref:Uncharacterized protein n=1 Tax=Effrenium voratum TaxID=2562239 RepID=A0AA36JMA1_9DINO|nr:unnamed protein product [Effrenium voratum]